MPQSTVILILISSVALLAVSFAVGIWSQKKATTAQAYFGGTAMFGPVVAGLIPILGCVGQPQVLTRMYAVKNPRDLPKAGLVTAVTHTIVGFLAVVAAYGALYLVATGKIDPLVSGDQAIYAFADYLGVFAQILVYAAILAAALSSASMFLTSSSTLLSKDLTSALGIKIAPEKQISVSRIFMFALGAIAIVVSIYSKEMVALLGTFGWGTLVSGTFPVFVMGLLWERCNEKGVMCGIIVSFVLNIIPFVGFKFPSALPACPPKSWASFWKRSARKCCFLRTFLPPASSTWGLHYGDSAVILLPLFHTGGWNLLTLPLLHAGGKIYLSRVYDPRQTLAVIQREKTTCLFGAATIFRMMVETPEFAAADLSSLRWIMAGAAPTPIGIMEEFWKKGVKFVLGYGMTEAGPNNLSTPAQFVPQQVVEEKFASVGKPMYLSLVRLIDDDGTEITEPDTPGELLWSGPQIFSGYWGNPEETAETLVDGWVHTGDMATVDRDGFYYIVGRKKNMFISGGENVFPPEIETALYDMPQVRECCVFGVPDEKWGEVGKAVLSVKPGMTLDKDRVLAHLAGKLARYKIPRYITFVDDVPKNSVGKIVVRQVTELYGRGED